MRFVIVHQADCNPSGMHYCVSADGHVEATLPANARGLHAQCVDVALEGTFESQPPAAAQMHALRALLVQLKLRYPDIRVGGHRQVRGARTSCPGRAFPLRELLAWSASGLLEARDAAIEDIVNRAYGP